jgi:hypothetical protein
VLVQLTRAAAAVLGDGAEELALGEVTVLVEVAEALLAAQLGLALSEAVVELVLGLLVPEEEVVGAGGVLGHVGPLTAAADGVADPPLPALVVEAVEQELGSVVPVAVVEVLEVDHVLVLDLPRVLRVPTAQDERRGQGLVAEFAQVEVAFVVVDLGEQDLLDELEREGVRALALVIAPLRFVLQTFQDVEDRGVVLAVVFVQRRAPVVGQDVVDEAPALGYVWLRTIHPALDEELLHVVVRDVLLGRNEVALGGRPVEAVARGELARVHQDVCFIFYKYGIFCVCFVYLKLFVVSSVQHRSPLFVDDERASDYFCILGFKSWIIILKVLGSEIFFDFRIFLLTFIFHFIVFFFKNVFLIGL